MKPRFYFSETLTAQTEINLPESLSKHLQVLRSQVGDEITLFDGEGTQISARIIEFNKKSVKVLLQNDLSKQAPSKLKLHLGQALCRFDRMDMILQKAVELNVSEITPVYAERSQGRLSGSQLERKMEHWRDIIISACEQCEQNYLPLLHAPIPLNQWLENVKADLKLHFALDHAVSLKTIGAQPSSCALMIGPEGGFTDKEETLADQNEFIRISLGKRILRVETTAILALGLINYQFS